MLRLGSLPVELIADIMGELDLSSLITMSQVSHLLRDIISDSSLNPWRMPILRCLRAGQPYDVSFKHLSVRSTVPRHNWIEILSLANGSYLCFEATLPNLKDQEWEECFKRRFLPGWVKWKRDVVIRWKELFIKTLFRVVHRSITPCTSEESWTTYIVLNRNGSANMLEASSRSFSPLNLFNEMKLQSNLAHLETRVRLVVELADVRIITFGTLNKPKSTLTVNSNAHIFLHPPGIENDKVSQRKDSNQSVERARTNSVAVAGLPPPSRSNSIVSDHGVYPIDDSISGYPAIMPVSPDGYSRLTKPLPAMSHVNYPRYTPGGTDKRWIITDSLEEEGLQWVGGLMVIAQILGPKTHELSGDWLPLQDLDLVIGPGRSQYASFNWLDLWAIAPWMEERITKKIDGPGLGT